MHETRVRRAWLACVAVTLAAWAPAAFAQSHREGLSPYPELRADAIVARHTATTVGAGLELPLGTYVRLALDANAGAAWINGGSTAVGRADVLSRFLLDPLREVPVGLSIGAGLSLPVQANAGPARPVLVGVIDLEGRRRGTWTPAAQIGLGGGLRVGFALRRSPRLTR